MMRVPVHVCVLHRSKEYFKNLFNTLDSGNGPALLVSSSSVRLETDLSVDGDSRHSRKYFFSGLLVNRNPHRRARPCYCAPSHQALLCLPRLRAPPRSLGGRPVLSAPEPPWGWVAQGTGGSPSLASRRRGGGRAERAVSATVAINLIVQHIQDILSGDLCKWQRGSNGRSYKRTFPEPGDRPGVLTAGKRSHLESSSRPH